MINEKLLERLQDNGIDEDEEVMLIDDPAFLDSVVGISSDGRAVYDYEIMAGELAKRYHMSVEDAYEHIDFNIVRALPHYGSKAPVIFDPIVNMDE